MVITFGLKTSVFMESQVSQIHKAFICLMRVDWEGKGRDINIYAQNFGANVCLCVSFSLCLYSVYHLAHMTLCSF